MKVAGGSHPLALELGFNCICTEPDGQQFEELTFNVRNRVSSAADKIRKAKEAKEEAEAKEQEAQSQEVERQDLLEIYRANYKAAGQTKEEAWKQAEIQLQAEEAAA